MKGIMKGIYVMTIILLMASVPPIGSPPSSVSAQEESVGTPLSSISAEEESDGILFEFHGGGITREPATETTAQIAIAHLCEADDELVLKAVEICGENGTRVKTLEVNGTLESVLDIYDQLKLLLGKLDSAPADEIAPQASTLIQELRSKSFSTGYFTLDLNDLKQPLTLGDRVPIIAEATLIHNGEALVIERSLSVEYRPSLTGSPPQGQATSSALQFQDWKPGVQHVHTGHSDRDLSYWFSTPPTVLEQAQAAANNDLSWIIITDHHTMMDAAEWNAEKNECEQAEISTGMKVMLGLEVGSCNIFSSHGHYLAYDIDSYVNPPNNCQDMIDEVNSQGGFGFIAHPYGGVLDTLNWDDWNVTGYTGLEIMNGSTASASAINKWNEILQDSSARIFAVGNPDAHFTEQVANSYTWCDIGETVTHSSVYSALKNGRSVVSNGPLIAFTIGDKKIGDTVYMTTAQAVLDIAWDALEPGETIQKIEVYSNEDNEDPIETVTDVSGIIAGSTSVMVNVNPQTLYVRLRGIFSNGEAYTNPIWVAVCGVEGLVWDAATGYPLPYSTVNAYEAEQLKGSASTNQYGQYEIRLAPGQYTVTASHIAFYDKTYTVVVTENGFTTLHFALTPMFPGLPIPLRK